MKSELVEFLNGFAREGKVSFTGSVVSPSRPLLPPLLPPLPWCVQVVARRDVEGFFEGLQQRKRRRLDTGDGVPPAKCHF